MNHVQIWCPYCKKYQWLVKVRDIFLLKGCGYYLLDENLKTIMKLDDLIETLKKGVWIVNGYKRRPKTITPQPSHSDVEPFVDKMKEVLSKLLEAK